MNKLYEKNQLTFALLWIVVYCVLQSLANPLNEVVGVEYSASAAFCILQAVILLVSSVYLESDLNLPFGKNGKFLFQLGYTPVVSDMKKVVQKTAALSFPKWALAVWDMDTATLYMVKYDRSH